MPLMSWRSARFGLRGPSDPKGRSPQTSSERNLGAAKQKLVASVKALRAVDDGMTASAPRRHRAQRRSALPAGWHHESGLRQGQGQG